MSRVDLTAFETAVVECQPVVNKLSQQIASIQQALNYLKMGIVAAEAESMYNACSNLANALSAELQAIQTVLTNIDKERGITAKRLGAGALT